MKRITLFVVLSFVYQCINAQTIEGEKGLRTTNSDTVEGWKVGGFISLNLSQASFTNWSAGGQNSFSLNSIFSGFAKYRHGKNTLDNMLDIGYGILQQGLNKQFIKTDDKIEFSSKYGRQASKKWYYAGLLNFRTQITSGYNYPNDSVEISNFMAPAYLLAAIGMDYRPNSHFSAFLAPFTSRTIIVNAQPLADAGSFGVEAAKYDTANNIIEHGKRVRNEIGGYVRMVYSHAFFKDKSVSLLSKLDLFSNYLHNPQNVDVNWETLISFKVNKFISASISTQLIYDNDTKVLVDKDGDGKLETSGPRTQFKQILGIGFSYKF